MLCNFSFLVFSFPIYSTSLLSPLSSSSINRSVCRKQRKTFTCDFCESCFVFIWPSFKPPELTRSFSFCSCVCFCLYGPANYMLHSIISPENSPLSHFVLPVLFLPYWSFQLLIFLYKSLPQSRCTPLWLTGVKALIN